MRGCRAGPIAFDQRVGKGGTGGLDGGFPCATLVRVREDPVLRRLKPDDRRRGESEREHGKDQGLPAISGHGVHSISLAAWPRTTSTGRPMNDSGAAIA